MNTDINALTCFSLSITDHVAHLVLNKPEAMNTMHPTFWRELGQITSTPTPHTDALLGLVRLMARTRRLY